MLPGVPAPKHCLKSAGCWYHLNIVVVILSTLLSAIRARPLLKPSCVGSSLKPHLYLKPMRSLAECVPLKGVYALVNRCQRVSFTTVILSEKNKIFNSPLRIFSRVKSQLSYYARFPAKRFPNYTTLVRFFSSVNSLKFNKSIVFPE